MSTIELKAGGRFTGLDLSAVDWTDRDLLDLELTDCTITGLEQAYYRNAGFHAEGDYALYPIYVLRGQGTAADGSVQDFEVLVYALAG